MHPGFYAWWKGHRHGHGCDAGRDARAWGPFGGRCGPPGGGPGAAFGADDGFGAGLGVRRPLRFLAHKLELREEQIAELARILGALKTERAQAEVDQQRTLAAFADAIEKAEFDEARALEGAELRTQSAAKLRVAVQAALGAIHRVLDPEQRARFAYLVRSGAITM